MPPTAQHSTPKPPPYHLTLPFSSIRENSCSTTAHRLQRRRTRRKQMHEPTAPAHPRDRVGPFPAFEQQRIRIPVLSQLQRILPILHPIQHRHPLNQIRASTKQALASTFLIIGRLRKIELRRCHRDRILAPSSPAPTTDRHRFCNSPTSTLINRYSTIANPSSASPIP